MSFTTGASDINPPEITSPENDATNIPIATTIEGTGLTGATVTVYSGAGTLGQAVVDGDGDWEVTPVPPLTAGTEYTINARQQLGNSVSGLSNNVTFTTAST